MSSAKRVELLLNRNVENLGIVGDVVKVKPGFARNYLLPHRIGEHPTPEKIEALKEARAKAQAEVAKIRSERETLVGRLENVTIKLIRSCNDQGVLYGAVSQRDIADQLVADGYGVDTRAVRLNLPIRRIGSYHCPIQFDRDLRAEITVDVLPDRTLEIMAHAAAAPEPEPEPETEAADAATETDGDAPAKPARKGKGGNKAERGEGKREGKKADASGEAHDEPKGESKGGSKGDKKSDPKGDRKRTPKA